MNFGFRTDHLFTIRKTKADFKQNMLAALFHTKMINEHLQSQE